MPIKKTVAKKATKKANKEIKFRRATDEEVAAYIRWCRMVDNIEKRKVSKLVIPDDESENAKDK